MAGNVIAEQSPTFFKNLELFSESLFELTKRVNSVSDTDVIEELRVSG